jgi:hypothetical protein
LLASLKFEDAFRLLTNMRQVALLCLSLAIALPARAAVREMEFEQARQIALTVAAYDNIKVDDRTIVMNSMDTRNEAGFIPGYFSFSIIRESDSSQTPDETIRMYVVSKKTADTWELNLCTHYSFPALQKIQREWTHDTASGDDPEMPKAIGCGNQAQVKTGPQTPVKDTP